MTELQAYFRREAACYALVELMAKNRARIAEKRPRSDAAQRGWMTRRRERMA